MVYECGSHCCQPKAIKRRVPYSHGGFAYEFSYVVRMRFFWFLRDVSTSRPRESRDPYAVPLALGQNVCGPCGASPKTTVDMGPCFRRDDSLRACAISQTLSQRSRRPITRMKKPGAGLIRAAGPKFRLWCLCPRSRQARWRRQTPLPHTRSQRSVC